MIVWCFVYHTCLSSLVVYLTFWPCCPLEYFVLFTGSA